MKKGFTIIIPTMWLYLNSLKQMVRKYADISLVKEILIIDNKPSKRIEFTEKKVRVIGIGKNQYVNPSWNFGVKEAKTEKVILANDDITIGNIDTLFTVIDSCLVPGMVMGMDTSCYAHGKKEWSLVKPEKMNYGFGVFMAIHKEDYKEVPKQFKVWYGDNIQFIANSPIVLSGIKIQTPMKGTTSTLNLRKERIQEKKSFLEYCKK
jgi:hypothetical protein